MRREAAGRAVLIGLVASYLALSLAEIDLPAIHEDVAVTAVAAMRVVAGQPEESEGWYPLQIGGRALPVLLTPTSGAIVGYAIAPFLRFFGMSIFSFRLGLIVWGAVGLGLTWLFVRRLAGDRPALLVAALMATNPSYILWCRDGFADVLSVPMLCGALLLALIWYRGGSAVPLYWTSFLIGVGFTSQSSFLLLPIAVAASTAVWFWQPLMARYRTARLTVDQWLLITYALAAGAAGRFWYHYHTTTLDPYALAAWWAEYRRVLAGYPDRLLDILRMFWLTLTGGWSAGSVDYLGGPSNFLSLPMLVVAVPTAWLLAALRRGSYAQRWIAWCGSIIVLTVLLLPLAPQPPYACNLMPLIPVAQAIVAVWLAEQWHLWRGARRLAVAALGAALLAMNLATLSGYRSAARQTGGAADFSDAIYACARDLDQATIRSPIACDWGFRHRLIFLTAGRVQPIEIWRTQRLSGQLVTLLTRTQVLLERLARTEETASLTGGSGVVLSRMAHRLNELLGDETSRSGEHEAVRRFEQRLARFLEDTERVYLFRIDPLIGMSRYDAFDRVVRAAGKEVRVGRLYRQRNGVPVLAVYSAVEVNRLDGRFPAAAVRSRNAEDVRVMSAAIGSDIRQALVIRPVSEVRFRVRLPQRAVLQFSTGIPDHCWVMGDGASGTVSIAAGDEEQIMFSQYLNPRSHPAERRWFDHQIDLGGWSGREIDLILRVYPGREIDVEAGDYDADWFSWANLRVSQRSRLEM